MRRRGAIVLFTTSEGRYEWWYPLDAVCFYPKGKRTATWSDSARTLPIALRKALRNEGLDLKVQFDAVNWIERNRS